VTIGFKRLRIGREMSVAGRFGLTRSHTLLYDSLAASMARTSPKSALHSSWFCRVGLALLLFQETLCGVHGKVVINEIMLNPFNPAHGQWFELYNTGNTIVSLDGWYIHATTNSGDDVSLYAFDSSVSIAANGYLTIGKNNASGYVDVIMSNLPNYPTNGTSIAGGPNVFLLDDNRFASSDALFWNINSMFIEQRILFSFAPGISNSRILSAFTTQDPRNWCFSSSFISTNERATPRDVNVVRCAAPPTNAPTKTPTVAPTKEPKGKKAPTSTSPTKYPSSTASPTQTPTKNPTKAPKGKKSTKAPKQTLGNQP
jgi:Lamin Tail Domain